MNNQKKKILLVITKSNFGGAQKYVFELARSLKYKGFHVHVALGGEGILIEKLKQENINVTQIHNLGRNISFGSDIKSLIRLIQTIKKYRPDIVHLNSSKIGGLGAFASRLCRVPKTIFTIHGWAFNEDRSSFQKLLIKFLYFIIILLCDYSIAVSEETKKQSRLIPFSFLIKNKIKVVKNGISTPEFFSKENARNFISSKINVDISNKKIIGQIAELHPIKSIETTIEAARYITSKYPDTLFVIIGEGEQRKILEDKIYQYKLQNKVFLTGFIDNAAQYIPAFDLFCLTSKSEALALVLIESGLAHVPVIASNVGGIPELITPSQTGFLFEAKNSLDLQSKIEFILTSPQENLKKITDNFYTKIQKEFLIEHMTNKTIQFY